MIDAPDGFELWVMDKDMGLVKKAYWYNAFEELPAGWFDELGENPESVDLAPGTGVLMSAGDNGIMMCQSGEVITDDITGLTINNGFTLFANPYAVAIPLANISMTNAPDGFELWVMDKDMGIVEKAYWYNAFEELPAGWFDELGETEVTGVSIATGKGVLFSAGDNGITANIASPFKK